MKLFGAWLVIILGCGKAKSEQATEQPIAKSNPAMAPVAAAPVDSSVVSLDVPIAATRAARAAFIAQLNAQLNKQQTTFRGTLGEPDTDFVVESVDASYVCDAEIVKWIVDNLGTAMRSGGFKRVACKNSAIANGLDTPAPVDAGVPSDAPPLVQTTAAKLFVDYTNEVAGDLKYRGKVIRLTGRILRIAKDPISARPFIALAAGSYGMNAVYAYITDPHDVIERKRGEEVRLLCVGDGTVMSLIPRLKGCEVEAWR